MLESFAVFGCDFSGVNIGRKLFDTLVRFLDVSAKLLTWCQRGIAEPVMANHAFLIGIGDRSRFELFHRSERLFDPWLHLLEEIIRKSHPADIDGKIEIAVVQKILLKKLPE